MQDFLLQEDGTKLLQENNDKIFLEQQADTVFTQLGGASFNNSS